MNKSELIIQAQKIEEKIRKLEADNLFDKHIRKIKLLENELENIDYQLNELLKEN